MISNIDAFNNTAVGAFALLNNDSTGNGLASANTAVGVSALGSNVDGDTNTAVGAIALASNDTGSRNNAVGFEAVYNNTTGFRNEAMGVNALFANDTGFENVAIGGGALINNVSGSFNTTVGDGTGDNIVAGTGNIYIGAGVDGPVDESAFIRIGDPNFAQPYDCFIQGIYGRTFGPADMAVRIGNDGKLGTVVSSRRFKHDIKPMEKVSEAILALKPVTFHYKSDAKNTPAFGLIAEDVAEVSPNLVVRDKEGKPLSVRYEDVNVMLLNEFIKEHRAFVEQQQKMEQQQKEIDLLKTELKQQRLLIQKVSDRVELNGSTSQVVANNQ
jgi:Chaperone of endosialidase